VGGVHQAAQSGFSTGAQAYVRGRPEYPPQLQSWLRDEVGLHGADRVVDLGAGTGKFTKLLAATGAQVVAVEPVAAMRAQLSAALPQVQVVDGTAEALPLSSSSSDVVVCAQAFHWFATRAALDQIHRVLKPAGRLALVWNVRDESVDWVRAITEIITPYEGNAPRFHTGQWRLAFEGAGFDALRLQVFAHQHVGTAQEVIVDRILSVSFIAALSARARARVAHRLRTLIETHPALRGRERVVFPYQTQAYWCLRLDDASVPGA
jgi:SAM-dependent methyltransferase